MTIIKLAQVCFRFSIALAICFCSASTLSAQDKIPVVLDADTANEVDDLYAIVRAFAVEEWDIKLLAATQWQVSQWASAETMEDSYRLNQMLANHLKPLAQTKVMRGGHRRMYDWGHQAVYSPSTHEIIRLASAQSAQQPLRIIALGALTNIASALAIDPSIENKIELFWLGSTYDFNEQRAEFTDFNALMDPHARALLYRSKVKMHVMPVSILSNYQFSFERTRNSFESKGELGRMLVDRWRQHADGGRQSRILWDLALIQALIYPERTEQVKASNFQNPNIHYYKSIDHKFFIDESYPAIVNALNITQQ